MRAKLAYSWNVGVMRRVCLFGAPAALLLRAAPAMAFDGPGYRSRLEALKAEIGTKMLADPSVTLGRLDELIVLGAAGTREYGASHAKFAKLMDTVAAGAAEMKGFSDAEIEAKWGESGSGGDAIGIPLKTLGQWDETRAAMELTVGPAHAYILVKKWVTAQKARWLEQARDELNELTEHLKKLSS